MILGVRRQQSDLFDGLQLFTLKEWHEPSDELGRRCFDVFDESLEKLKSDSEATRIQDISLNEKEVTLLNTATETALRALPVKFKEAASLFTIARARSDQRKIYFRLPAWIRLQSEDHKGTLHHLHNLTTDATWRELALLPQEIALHLRLFGDTDTPVLREMPALVFFRIAELFPSASLLAQAPTLTLFTPNGDMK